MRCSGVIEASNANTVQTTTIRTIIRAHGAKIWLSQSIRSSASNSYTRCICSSFPLYPWHKVDFGNWSISSQRIRQHWFDLGTRPIEWPMVNEPQLDTKQLSVL